MPNDSDRAYRGELTDPEWRRERAGKARAEQPSIDHYIARLVGAAPALNAEQRDRLASLFSGVDIGDRERRRSAA